MARYLDQVRHF
jgi:hypothetical protein